MRRLLLICALGISGCGAGTVALPIPIPIPLIPPSAAWVPLDGQWVLAGGVGPRSCLVIQESRISILDLVCSSDGLGLVAQIRESPLIARSGNTIVMSVTYTAKSGEERPSKLSFVGELQVDGNFVGIRRDETINPAKNEIEYVERFSVLSRL